MPKSAAHRFSLRVVITGRTARTAVWRGIAGLLVSAAVFFAQPATTFLTNAMGMNEQAYETRLGDQRHLHLEDGSNIILNTDSEIRVRISPQKREIQLIRGEALFIAAPDSSRPFDVHAGGNVVRALGTRFSVRIRQEHRIDVLLAEGKLALYASEDSGEMASGEYAILQRGKITIDTMDPWQLDGRLAWTNGILVFSGEPLDEVIMEFNRYNTRKLSIGDATLNDEPVSGRFRATDIVTFVALLKQLGARPAETSAHAEADIRIIRIPPGGR